MKQFLKSALVIVIALAVGAGATGAFFTSNVVAPNNQINAGTLALAIDSSISTSNGGVGQTFGLPYTWTVAYQAANGTNTTGLPFTPWNNAAPGDTNDYYVAIRNIGTVTSQFRATAVGRWTAGPRFGTTLPGPDTIPGNGDDLVCPATPAAADPTLVSVSNVRQYATANCLGETGCENLYYGLTNSGYTNAAGMSGADLGSVTGYFYGVTSGAPTQANPARIALGGNQFAIYRVTTALNGPGTNDCYQGAQYTFDLRVEGKQPIDPAW